MTTAREAEVMPPNGSNAAPPAGAMERTGFGTRDLMRQTEVAAMAEAAKARAAVEARYIMAMNRPRDWDDVRVRILKECNRPGFADAAWFDVPNRGKGLNINFYSTALRVMGNVDVKQRVIADDDGAPGIAGKRTIEVDVIDLETNAGYSTQWTFSKVVERYDTRGRDVVGERVTSAGKRIFLVKATEEECLGVQLSLASKLLRVGGRRVLPGDIAAEAQSAIVTRLNERATKDPDGERKSLADAFARMNVMPSALAEYLGHDLGTCTPAELVALRGLWSAINAGELSWQEALAAKAEDDPQASRADKLAKDMAAKAKTQAPPAPAAPPAAASQPVTTEAASVTAARAEGVAAARRQDSAKVCPFAAGTAERVAWLGGHTAEADAMSRSQPEPGSAG